MPICSSKWYNHANITSCGLWLSANYLSFLFCLEFLSGSWHAVESTASQLCKGPYMAHFDDTLSPTNVSFYLSPKPGASLLTWVNKNVLFTRLFRILLPRLCSLNLPCHFFVFPYLTLVPPSWSVMVGLGTFHIFSSLEFLLQQCPITFSF